jgi:hypothetical protein
MQHALSRTGPASGSVSSDLDARLTSPTLASRRAGTGSRRWPSDESTPIWGGFRSMLAAGGAAVARKGKAASTT